MRLLTKLLFGSLLLLRLLASEPAAAESEDDERARLHFEAGRSYFEEARYEDAEREFAESFRLSNRAPLLLNLALAQERALHLDLAVASLQRYLELVPDAEDRNSVEKRIAHLQELQQRLAAQAAPAAGATPSPDAPAQNAEAKPPAAPPPATAQHETAAPAERNPRRLPAFVLIGVGGASIVASVITGVMAHSKYSSLSDHCTGGVCKQSAQSDIDSGKTLALVSTVLTGVGIAAAGVGAALLFIGGGQTQEHADANRTRAQLTTGPTGLGTGFRLDF